MDKISLLMVAAGAAIFSAVLAGMILHFTSKKQRLRKLLREMEHQVSSESADLLKSKYVQAYHLYLKLSEKKKQNFYGRLTALREKMEEQMKAVKKVEELLEKSSLHNITLLQQQYDEMYVSFRKLPTSVQQKYYPQIMHVKEVLEQGLPG